MDTVGTWIAKADQFITENYGVLSVSQIARELGSSRSFIERRVQLLKLELPPKDSAVPNKPKSKIALMEKRLEELYQELKSLTGKEWDDKVREIHNLGVDIMMKKRQINTDKSKACYSDEVQTYYLPNL